MKAHQSLYQGARRALFKFGAPVGLSLVALVGCDQPSEGGGEATQAEPLTHESAQALIRESVQANSAALEERLRYLDGDTRLLQAFQELFGSEDCYVFVDEEGNEEEECESGDSEEEAIRIDFMEGTEDMISGILDELPADAQIAEATQLTYRIDPSELCGVVSVDSDDEFDDFEEAEAPAEFPEEFPEDDVPEDDFPENDFEDEDFEEESEPSPECLAVAEREAPQVRLTGVGDGLEAALLVAQGQESVGSVTLTSNLARVSLDLGVIARVIREISNEGEGEGEGFQVELEGAISLEMDTSEAGRAIFRFNVDRAIRVTGQFEDASALDLSFPAAENVFSLTSDSADSSLALRLDIPKLVESFSASLTETYDYDPETGEEILVEQGPVRNIVATLGGLDLGAALRLVGEGVETSFEVGLGDESSHVEIDGQRIVQVDLNPNNGRLISLSLDRSDFESEDLVLALASELHELKIETKLGLISEFEAPEWIADEIFKFAFLSAGGDLPSIALDSANEQLQILTGTLEMTAERAGLSHSAEGGQCMMPIEREEPISEGFSDEYEEPIESEQTHPFEDMEVGMCR